jgi:hypothetical protein
MVRRGQIIKTINSTLHVSKSNSIGRFRWPIQSLFRETLFRAGQFCLLCSRGQTRLAHWRFQRLGCVSQSHEAAARRGLADPNQSKPWAPPLFVPSGWETRAGPARTRRRAKSQQRTRIHDRRELSLAEAFRLLIPRALPSLLQFLFRALFGKKTLEHRPAFGFAHASRDQTSVIK